VDEMLGNIVRWLRILGFDTLAASDLRRDIREDIDTKIILTALETGRILVTADVQLVKRAESLGIKVIRIDNRDTNTCDVLRKILCTLNLIDVARKNKMTRCPVCNGVLRRARKEEALGHVPQRVYETVNDFWVCTKCKKFYWIGSHYHNIKKVISRVLGEES